MKTHRIFQRSCSRPTTTISGNKSMLLSLPLSLYTSLYQALQQPPHIRHQKRILYHIHNLHQVHLPVEFPQACNIHSYLTLNWISLSQFHHMHQVNLSVYTPQFYHHHTTPSILRNHHRKLHQFQLLLPVFLLVSSPKVWHLDYHLISHHRSLYMFYLLYLATILVFRCKAWNIQSHLRCHFRILFQLHHLFPVKIPVNTPLVFQQYYHL